MTTSTAPAASAASSPETARHLLRTTWKATMSTLDAASGAPYGSLVAVAAAPDGTPLLLLSQLALHTRNIAADDRCSLLIDGTVAGPDALTGPRLTIVGRLVRLGPAPAPAPVVAIDPDVARRRYLARHPGAAMFADFADFGFYGLAVEWGHLVAGFGRIVRLPREEIVQPVTEAASVLAAECDILQHMNTDHAGAIREMAMHLGGVQTIGHWHMVGCDPYGVDLVCAEHHAAVRLDFPQRAITPEDVRTSLIKLVSEARRRASHQPA